MWSIEITDESVWIGISSDRSEAKRLESARTFEYSQNSERHGNTDWVAVEPFVTVHLDPDLEGDPVRAYLHRVARHSSGTTKRRDPVDKWTDWISEQTGLGGREGLEAAPADPFAEHASNGEPDSTVYLWFEDPEGHPAWKHDPGLQGTEFVVTSARPERITFKHTETHTMRG